MIKRNLFKHLVLLLSCFVLQGVFAQKFSVQRVDPPFWWAGMKQKDLQLCFYGNDLKDVKFSLKSDNAYIVKVTYAESPNYVFVDVTFKSDAKACTLDFKLSKNKKDITYSYEIKQRESNPLAHKGYTQEDFIYLILPDRFCNGNKDNDVRVGMNETTSNRDSMFLRHGGDLEGIMSKLDYLEDLGATALWLNPVLENNQPFASYHGYAITDHYTIDKRFGTNELYKKFVATCHQKGIKVIKDMVFNHVGNQHWFYKDRPFKDWTHEHDSFMFSNFRVTTLLDPYKSQYDLDKMQYGWFDKHMPDLNHSNPFLAKYLIQNALWWIEYAGLNGFRFDTYAYSDYGFMSILCGTILDEYPQFNMVGEVWDNGVVIQAFFTKENCNNKYFKNTNLPGITDFQLYHAINNMMHEEYGWNKGVERIYYTLCSDIAYKNPFNNLIFLDNHDLSRFYSVAGEDIKKYKMALGFLLTTRGIPMIYYGTEILMKNFKGPDEKVREDFPGGWQEDKENKFLSQYRSPQEQDAFDFVRTLARWRQTSEAVKKGKLKQFVPDAGVYVYFRYHANDKVMVIMNTSAETKTIDSKRYAEIIENAEKGKNVVNGNILQIQDLTIDAQSILILELLK